MHSQDENTIVWADMAKAFCIILVVMLHAGQVAPAAGWDSWNAIQQNWDSANLVIRPMRMPVFFLISGMLASASIMQPQSDTLWKRALKPTYLYFLWAAIFVTIIPAYPGAEPTDLGLVERVTRVMLMLSPAWYMLALAGFYCVARISKSWNLPAVLLGCAALSVFGSVIQDTLGVHAMMCRCLLFFIAGVRMKDQVLHFAQTASVTRTVVTGFLYAAGAAVSLAANRFLLPVDVLAVAFIVQFAAVLAGKFPTIVGPATWLGKRTLLVYLLHFPVLVYLTAYCHDHLGTRHMGSPALGAMLPLLLGSLALPICLLLGEALQRIGLGQWLFDLPPVLRLKTRPALPARRAVWSA